MCCHLMLCLHLSETKKRISDVQKYKLSLQKFLFIGKLISPIFHIEELDLTDMR